MSPEHIIGKKAVKLLRLAGFEVIKSERPPRVKHLYKCPMCSYQAYGGDVDAFVDWGLIWHTKCVSPYQVSPSKRGDNLPMVHEEVPA